LLLLCSLVLVAPGVLAVVLAVAVAVAVAEGLLLMQL
jgi:hypothetical protein